MATPYNPLTSPGLSRKAISRQARRRAHADTVAAAAKLPSDNVVRQAGESLIASLRKTVDPYSQIVANAGHSYADATAGAKADQAGVNAQLGLPGGAPSPPDTRGGLLGAMAANSLSSLSGSVIGATEALPGRIAANAGKRASVMSGEDALYENYLQKGYDDALRTAAAQSNAQLSAATLASTDAGRQAQIRQGDTRNAIAQQNATTARMRLDQALATTTDKTLQAAMKAAAASINKTLAGRGKQTKTIGATYTFTLPVAEASIYKTGVKPLDIKIDAKNGAEAFTKFVAQLKSMKAGGALTNYAVNPDDPHLQASVYYHGVNTPRTVDVELAGSRTAALHEAARILEVTGMSHADAIALARKFLGNPPSGKKTKPKPDRLNAGH